MSRVLLLTQYYSPEPARMVRGLQRELIARGHSVHVLTGFPNYPGGELYPGYELRRVGTDVVDGARVRRTWLHPDHSRAIGGRLANYGSFAVSSLLNGWDLLRSADVIYVYGSPVTAALPAWVTRRLRNVPYVVHVQDLWPDSVVHSGFLKQNLVGRAISATLRRVSIELYARASSVIAIAPSMRDLLTKRGLEPKRVSVVLNWADEAQPEIEPANGPAQRRSLGLSDDEVVVMYGGNIGDLQGLETAVRAAAEVQDLKTFTLMIVGDGVALADLREVAHQTGAANVRFLPKVSAARFTELSAAADAQLVTLRDLEFFRGTIPGKLQQVMASGQAVICAVPGDTAAIVERAGAGWVVEPESPVALTATFRELHSSRDAAQRLGRAGRRYYRDHLAEKHGASAIARILEDTAK